MNCFLFSFPCHCRKKPKVVCEKSKKQQRHFEVTSDDLWFIRDELAGKKSNLGKTCKTNREVNDKVHDLNQQTSKYVETLALLHANFERICTEKEVEGAIWPGLRRVSENAFRNPCSLH